MRRMEPSADILFIGTRDKIESRIVPQRGYKFRTIWISGFHRGWNVRNLMFPLKLITAMIQSRSIMASFGPDVVVGTGGYVAGPVLNAAFKFNIPALIHEQNSYPGVTTRMLARNADEVHLTFERSKKYLARIDNVFVSGNPTRDDLMHANREDALRYFTFSARDPRLTLLVFGGSLGAHSINLAIRSLVDRFVEQNFRLIWQTGQHDLPMARDASASHGNGSLWVGDFIDRMDYAYEASDLVICRAGATTIAELSLLGKPAILVPYPLASAGHQLENAQSLVDAGAAILLNDDELLERLMPAIVESCAQDRLRSMSDKSRNLGRPNAAADIARRAIALAERHRGKLNNIA